MKKQTVVKRFIGLVLGLIMALGVAMPVMAAEEKIIQAGPYTFVLDGFVRATTEILYFSSDMPGEAITVYWISPNSAITAAINTDELSAEWIASLQIPEPYFGLTYSQEFEGRTFWEMTVINHDLFEEPNIVVFEDLSRFGTTLGHIFALNGAQSPQERYQVWFGIYSQTQLPTTAPNLSTASAWAHDGITNAVAADLVPQPLQNYYTNNITRAEFTALAVLLYETTTGREITGRVTFDDTTDVNVQKAAYTGIVSGTGNNNFSPNMQFNREQASVILSRLVAAIGEPLPQAVLTFADSAQVSDWATESVGQVQAAGIMGGVGDNIFDPQGTFTREQSIITILRLFERTN